MDNNVSKNTNSHNFFKLRLEREKLDTSVRDLLSKELLLSLTLYQQKYKVKIEQSWLTKIVKNKTTILKHKNSITSLTKFSTTDISSVRNLMLITYGCPLGLSLTTTLQQSPAIIVKRLGDLLILERKNNERDSKFELLIEIQASGWINFYLDHKFVASWLDKLLYLSQTITTQQLTKETLPLDRKDGFLVQYLHARCCSLLALGVREKMLVLNLSNQIRHPESIAWLDEQQNLWLREEAEYNLLRQLLIVTDAWVGDRDNRNYQWAKLALNLSKATAVFLADCRFLGEVKVEYPQLAIARLGLIALVQFWLEKILQTKLNMAAPKER